MHAAVVIPTLNRPAQTRAAVRAALDQSHPDLSVVVVDDGSTDDTVAALGPLRDDPRLTVIALARNMGTAQAKNAALALFPADAYSFHDSDDRPDPDKILRQVRRLARAVDPDPGLDWGLTPHRAGTPAEVAVALTAHRFIRADGSVMVVDRALSLIDDFFPHLQVDDSAPGDWILVNSALFRARLFADHGGFHPGVEEDREIRNRLIMAGEIMSLIRAPLLTKIECADSLTVRAGSDYASAARAADRAEVQARLARWRRTGEVARQPIDLADLALAPGSDAGRLRVTGALMTDATRAHLGRLVR